MLGDAKRWQHFLAMVLIGDGVMGLVRPRRDAHAWSKGPKPWRELMQFLGERPALTRTIAAVQVIGGIAWALQQEKQD